MDFLRKLKEKNEAAFGCLYDRYAPALLGLILKLTSEERLANSILEKSFLKFWNQIEYFDLQKNHLFIWMVRITINYCKEVLMLTNETILKQLTGNIILRLID